MAKLKVKIAVAVMPNGEWNCCGWGQPIGKEQPTEKEMMNLAVDTMPDGETRYWVNVELPLPEDRVLKGEVVKA